MVSVALSSRKTSAVICRSATRRSAAGALRVRAIARERLALPADLPAVQSPPDGADRAAVRLDSAVDGLRPSDEAGRHALRFAKCGKPRGFRMFPLPLRHYNENVCSLHANRGQYVERNRRDHVSSWPQEREDGSVLAPLGRQSQFGSWLHVQRMRQTSAAVCGNRLGITVWSPLDAEDRAGSRFRV